ncbi:uncharacterized protein PHACADRAFT_148941 [Phanerochaete carnosa HHB-10118-sp]|uniref:Uncharacterized protein n=1 Tax=Phanerochaete carnosa (strain HHB-10118-sp) TaxID=650164 RepID=K5W0H6_PHACS|nr:uncharacterized protein PHACADRAFT_148941 [Phanerochaete carnosa HHB-10118-sp]EKM52364.1 hypothetical protein PHACADRAFT_148941 [Phanerochaete carnosa HHB-10118-sp]
MPDAYNTRSNWPGSRPCADAVWVVYSTHQEAAASLSLSHPSLARVEPALETDLEPYEKLEQIMPGGVISRRDSLSLAAAPGSPVVHCATPSSSSSSSMGLLTPTTPDFFATSKLSPPPLPHSKFTLSTNPPNPKISYRPGDWV